MNVANYSFGMTGVISGSRNTIIVISVRLVGDRKDFIQFSVKS